MPRTEPASAAAAGVLRRANASDLAAVSACARAAYAKYVPRMDREPAPMNADFEAQIARGHVWVVVQDREVAGYAVSYPEGDHLHLENVAVQPALAGCGLGRQLIEHVERTARREGYAAVELYTNVAMTENLTMYPKLGYVETGRRREDGFERVFFRKSVP